MKKLIRITTVPLSLEKLLEDQGQFFRRYYTITYISSQKERLKKVAEQQGVEHFPLDLTRKITPLKDLKALYRLFRFLQGHRPEIVHTHTPKAGIVGMLAAFLARVPLRIHTVAGLPLMEAKGMKKIILRFVERLTYRCATNVFSNSKGLQAYILEQRLTDAQKMTLIGQGSSNGIDTSHFQPQDKHSKTIQSLRATLGINKEDFLFCFVGRLVSDKGINELVVAFSQVHKHYPNTKLLLVGPEEADLDPLKLSTRNKIQTNTNIITTGFQNDIRPYLTMADAFVFPSYREGFPNVVLQAGAMEVPCIVSDINGCNEIITNGETGRIVPPKDVQALQMAMEEFAQQPELIKQFANANRQQILAKFERKVFWHNLLHQYQSLEKQLP